MSSKAKRKPRSRAERRARADRRTTQRQSRTRTRDGSYAFAGQVVVVVDGEIKRAGDPKDLRPDFHAPGPEWKDGRPPLAAPRGARRAPLWLREKIEAENLGDFLREMNEIA